MTERTTATAILHPSRRSSWFSLGVETLAHRGATFNIETCAELYCPPDSPMVVQRFSLGEHDPANEILTEQYLSKEDDEDLFSSFQFWYWDGTWGEELATLTLKLFDAVVDAKEVA